MAYFLAAFSKKKWEQEWGMMSMNTNRLEKLCGSFGVSSGEYEAARILREGYAPFCDEWKRDRLGSIFAIKKSKNPKAATFMIASPLDEVGLMISEVKKDGTLAFIPLENIACSSLLHQRVRILTREETYMEGVVSMGKKALEDSCEIKNAEELFIACGMGYEEVKEVVHPGDLAGYASMYTQSNGTVIAKALFPRVLNEVTLEVLEKIQSAELDFHVAVGGIAQSVVGYRGTKTATYVVRPDAAIALTAFDTAQKKIQPGDGVILGYYDRQMLPSQALLHDFSQKTETKAYFGLMGNDGSFIHKTLKGTPTISAGVAVDNVGSANEICKVSDVDALVDALVSYLHTIDSKKIAEFGLGYKND